MEKEYETLDTLFASIDLGFVEKVLLSEYHEEGKAGRPPRNPLGIFKSQIVRRLLDIPSNRKLVRRLEGDPGLREVCDIAEDEGPYSESCLSDFKKRIGPERLQCIMDHVVGELMNGGVIEGEKVVLDATFIKAYSKRDPEDNTKGYSDPDARVGRAKKGMELGYKVHIAVDAKSELPIAAIVVPANENEKKHAPTLLKKSLRFVRPKMLVADSQYSCEAFREECKRKGVEPIIPYPANQRKGENGLLRVDRKFRAHGPTRLKRLFRKRPSIERANSRLKDLIALRAHRLRGLRNITIHVLYCILAMLFVALAAMKIGRSSKVRSITYFTSYGVKFRTC